MPRTKVTIDPSPPRLPSREELRADNLFATPHAVCECPRPISSGRVYFGHEACVACGRLIVSDHIREYLAQAYRAREAERLRSRAGGLKDLLSA